MRISVLLAGCVLLLPGASGAAGPGAAPGGKAPAVRSGSYQFTRYSLEEGLSQGQIFCIAQDRRGFLWIGTQDGLNRFDGYKFTVFNHAPFDTTSLSHNRITSLCADREGNLWVGTPHGLNLLPAGAVDFRRFSRYPGNLKDLASKMITCLHREDEGYLWVGTEDGLRRFDPGTESLIRYSHSSSDPISLSGNRVLELYEDSSGHLWVGTDKGVDRFDPVTGGFKRYGGDPASGVATLGGVRAIAETETGSLLLGTASGVWKMDLNGNLERVPLLGAADAAGSHGGEGILVTDITKDGQGRFWVATFDGIFILTPDLERSDRLRHADGDATSLSQTAVNCVFQDGCEVVWVGTNGYGVNSWSPYLSKFERHSYGAEVAGGMSVQSLRAIYEDPTGAVWVGGYGCALDRLDPDTGEFQSFVNSFGGATYAIAGDPDRPSEVLWIGTEGSGLVRYDVPSRTFRRYPSGVEDRTGLCGRYVYAVGADSAGDLWIGTDRGVNVMDRASGTFSTVEGLPDGGSVRAIGFDRAGFVWIGASNGVTRFDPATSRCTNYHHDPEDPASLSEDNVFCIYEDSRGIVWVGTNGGGLNRFFGRSGRFVHYTVGEGLPNNVVYGILEDGDGMLWLSTNAGLARFDADTGEIRCYEVDDGLQSAEFNAGAYHKGLSGRLYFGGISGFNVIRPSSLRDDPHPPSVVVSDFLLNNKSVPVGTMGDGRRLLDRMISETRRLHLDHHHGVTSFELAAMNFAVPTRNTYAYKLEGLDQDWNYIGNRRHITFTALEPGRYVLEIKAANSDGVWSDPVAALELAVTPPLWATWWFKVSAFIAVALIGLGLYRARTSEIRKRSAELMASKEFLDSIINALDDPVFVKDEKHRWVVVNDSACDMFGLPREGVLGRTDGEVLPEDQAEMLGRAEDEALDSEVSVKTDDVVNLRGKRRTIATKRAVFADRSTGKRYVASSVRDITDIKRYERALEDRLNFESLVSRISTDLINLPVSDIDDVIDDGLQEIGEFFGADRVVIRLMGVHEDGPTKVYVWSADGSTGSLVRDDFETAFPNLAREIKKDREVVLGSINDVPASWRPEREHMAEIGIESGVIVPLSVGGAFMGSISVLALGGRREWDESTAPRVRVLGTTLANALNRKRAEENLRQSQQKYWSILENIGIGIALVGRDMRILEANKKMRGWFPADGADDGAPGSGQDDGAEYAHRGPDHPTAMTLLDGLVHETPLAMQVEGRLVNFRVVSSPIRSTDGEVVAAIELVEDVTEKQRLEEQLRHSQKMQAIGTLAGGIAHDFNNILYAILGYANLAKADLAPGETLHGYLEQIETAGHRAAELVDHILAFGRRSEASFKPLGLQALIAEALKLLHGSLPATVEIRRSISDACGMIEGDPTQIHQLLVNLCTNAYQAMPERKGTIEIRLNEVDVEGRLVRRLHGIAAGRYARLVVSDDGVGMDDETMRRIFEPYFTTKKQGEGSGLGLATVHGIVKNHGGAVRVKSKPGFGTAFEIYIPICNDVPEREEHRQVESGRSAVQASVLFVDDEPMIADMCEKILGKIGHRVSKFTDGVAALEAFRRDPFAYDLIISDVTMPRLTGTELADEVRAVREDVPIVLCTGYSEAVDPSVLEELNVQKCVWKPLTVEKLAELVQEALGSPRATEV
jgi:PAS domain S-box-containing protein